MEPIRVTGRQQSWLALFPIEPLGGAIVFCLLWALPLAAQAPPRPPEPWMNDPPTSTGLAVGAKIPPFRAPDQNGRMQDFGSIRGPKGAAIYFVRSADW